MFCPGCSTQAADGAKFCKSCGMNLTAITQALTGGGLMPDPARDREYKRARRQISTGINGAAIGVALLAAAGVAYFLIPNAPFAYATTLILALAGLLKLFRNIGNIIDAKVGNKLIDPTLQVRTTGGLSVSGNSGSIAAAKPVASTQGATPGAARPVAPTARVAPTGALGKAGSAPLNPPAAAAPPPSMTGRVNREQSTPLKKLDFEDELMARLRN